MFEMICLGLSVGVLSGFFGIGGGTILVPALLLIGYGIKDAVGISVVQMVFSSVYGSYLNNKKGNLDIPMVINIALGGFIGALFSGYITNYFSSQVLEYIFLSFVTFALFRLFFKTKEHRDEKKLNKILLFAIGLFLGLISMTIGVGGSILLVPILVGFLHIPLKKAISAGLFFVVFSSISGFISHSISGNINYMDGLIIGAISLVGVYIGILFKDKIDVDLHKKILIAFYLSVLIFLVQRVILPHKNQTTFQESLFLK